MLLDIGQLIDLACGTPEAGVVNFNALHALLHIFRQQFQLSAHRVQFGEGCQHLAAMCDRIPAQTPFDIQTIKAESVSSNVDGHVNTVLVVRRKPATVTLAEPKEEQDSKSVDGGGSAQDESDWTPAGRLDGELVIDKTVADVPADDENSDVSSVSVQWTSRELDDFRHAGKESDLSKRLDAIERNVHQLIEALKDMGINYTRSGADHMSKPGAPNHETTERTITPRPVNCYKLDEFNPDDFNRLRNDFDYIKVAVQRLALCTGLPDIANHLLHDIKHLQRTTADSDDEDDTSHPTKNAISEELSNRMQALDHSVESLERRMAVTEKRMYGIDQEFTDIGGRTDKILAAIEAKASQELDTAVMSAQLNEVSQRIQQNDVACMQLQRLSDERLAQCTSLADRLDLLQQQKIDRAEAEERLAEKADYHLVKRKVSADQFDAATRQLSHSLSEAHAQLASLEASANDSRLTLLAALQERSTHGQLDQMRDQLSERLQAQAKKLRELSVVKSEPEAAGTRMRLLRNTNCISCEQRVVQRCDEEAPVPRAAEAHTMRSKRPQQLFELERIRAELYGSVATNPGTVVRNLHHFEQMMKGTDKVHMCERYCGGSHTMIGAHASGQRQLPVRGASTKAVGIAGPAYVMHGTDGTVYKVGLPVSEGMLEAGAPPKK